MTSPAVAGEEMKVAYRAYQNTHTNPPQRWVSDFEKHVDGRATIKPNAGVNLDGVSMKMQSASDIVYDHSSSFGLGLPQITEGERQFYPKGHSREGQRDEGFHPMGLGLDFSTKGWSRAQLDEVETSLHAAGYQTLSTDHGTGLHLHIELDTPETKLQLNQRRGGIRAIGAMAAYPKLQANFEREFDAGSAGPVMMRLQRTLGATEDGFWGPQTEGAFKTYIDRFGPTLLGQSLTGSR